LQADEERKAEEARFEAAEEARRHTAASQLQTVLGAMYMTMVANAPPKEAKKKKKGKGKKK
jgi:hypothetical protein